MRINNRKTRFFAALGLVSATAMSAAIATPAHAQEARRQFDIPAQPLASALIEFSRQSDAVVTAPSRLTRGKSAPGVRGAYTNRQALDRLLEGSGLEARPASGGSWVIAARAGAQDPGSGESEAGSAAANDASANGSEEAEEIVVTGSRLRGARSASPTLAITKEDMRVSGHAHLGDVIRDIAQNFTGGQNPGIVNGFEGNNTNFSSASSLNLRGLGPDATLTLLNGKRLPFNGGSQAVDISAIPMAAVDRIEIVTDGASAIYGSDAVAGIANIILDRTFAGVSLAARAGFATEGGGTQQQYEIASGKTWADGNVLATYTFQADGPIYADQRRYTEYLPAPTNLTPDIERHNVLISANHNITHNWSLGVDAAYSRRNSKLSSTTTTRTDSLQRSDLWFAAANSHLDIGEWRLSLSGSYGADNSRVSNDITSGGVSIGQTNACTCN